MRKTIRNKSPKPGASPSYTRYTTTNDKGKTCTILLTPMEFARAKDRAKKNPEDCR